MKIEITASQIKQCIDEWQKHGLNIEASIIVSNGRVRHFGATNVGLKSKVDRDALEKFVHEKVVACLRKPPSAVKPGVDGWYSVSRVLMYTRLYPLFDGDGVAINRMLQTASELEISQAPQAKNGKRKSLVRLKEKS
jgi:hypothetical protein